MIPFRVSEEPVKWQECAASVTEDSIAAAISWVEKMAFEPVAVREVSCLDSLVEAGKDETVSVNPWPAQVTKLNCILCVFPLLIWVSSWHHH